MKRMPFQWHSNCRWRELYNSQRFDNEQDGTDCLPGIGKWAKNGSDHDETVTSSLRSNLLLRRLKSEADFAGVSSTLQCILC